VAAVTWGYPMVAQSPPWRNASYLAMVRDWFYPDHTKQDVFSGTLLDSATDMRQRAIDKVNLWMFKAGRLPPALLATANLTEALLHDEARRTGTRLSESAMQSIYAMAFARFVNGFVDRDVARTYAAELAKEEDSAASEDDLPKASAVSGRGESSMYAHAATIGMPQRFVDLRHQVAHGELPSTAHLRKMTELALEWLWERWWIKNATGTPHLAVREIGERRAAAQQACMAQELARSRSDMVLDA
jgi:ribosomal biogenesis protein LAS1